MVKSNGRAVLTGEHFMNGDVASAEGALAAGCRFFGGYPITPATEIAEHMSHRLPEIGGIYIQMEDEIAAMASIIGAAWGGGKTMTSTSGPGFSLMMENIGLAIMTETPCVLVNVQRCGPSTGLPTSVGQQDMMQARWGSHGDYEVIALCPNSPQEMFDMTVDAFNLAERFRTVVLLLSDEVVGHMTERVAIPPAEELKIEPRQKPAQTGRALPYGFTNGEAPPMPPLGEGHAIHVTGLTHNEKGYPALDFDTHRRLTDHLCQKILSRREELTRVECQGLEGADVAVVAYGITSRVAQQSIKAAREQGLKVGQLRLQIVWPFPEQLIAELAGQVGAIVVPEINMGQMVREVERCVKGRCEVISVPHAGGGIHDPAEITAAIARAAQFAADRNKA